MAIRILCSTLLAALVALTGCSDKSSYFSQSPGPDNVTGGGGGYTAPKDTPKPDGNQGVDESSSTIADRAPTSEGPGDPPEPVPEPGTILLFGVGLTGLAVYRRRRRPAAQTV